MKRLWIVTTIILTLVISYAGCIGNNDEISYAKAGEIELTISFSDTTFDINDTEMTMKISIKNISNNTVAISNHVKQKVGIYTHLIFNNKTFINFGNQANFEKDTKLELKRNEIVDFSYDIINQGYLEYLNNEVGDPLHFPQLGDFKIYVEYKSHNYDTIAISNTIQLKII